MSRRQRIRGFVRRKYTLNPFCPECGVKMVLVDELPGYKIGKSRIKHFPPNTCTYDHTYSRLDLNRGVGNYTNSIMCYKCNHAKGVHDQNKFDEQFEQAIKQLI